MKTHRILILAVAALMLTLAASPVRADSLYPRENLVDRDDNSELVSSYVRTAKLAKVNKDYEKAKEFLVRAVRLDDENEQAWTELAWVCNELKEYELGAAASVMALDINKENADAWREAGYALLKMGEAEKAVKALRIAKRLAPNDESITKYLKQALEALKGTGAGIRL